MRLHWEMRFCSGTREKADCISALASQMEADGGQFGEFAAAASLVANPPSLTTLTTLTYVLIRYGHRRSMRPPVIRHQSSGVTSQLRDWGGPGGTGSSERAAGNRLVGGGGGYLHFALLQCVEHAPQPVSGSIAVRAKGGDLDRVDWSIDGKELKANLV